MRSLTGTYYLLMVMTVLACENPPPQTIEEIPVSKKESLVSPQIISIDTPSLSFSIQDYIPNGFALLDVIDGDLNLDPYRDMILVLKIPGEDTASYAGDYTRPLLLFLGGPENKYKLVARNDDLVYCYSCGGIFGDPYNDVTISNGTFILNHFGGSNLRWSNEYIFKYSPADSTWLLEKIIDQGWHVFELDKIDSTVKTSKDFGVKTINNFLHTD